ncbi:MAG: MlaD family protein [Proteobacteria bacterium]|nr:MlaD family protein [Pseudomonadota bacterium]
MKIYLSYRERLAGIFLVLAVAVVVLFVAGAAIQNRWFATRVTFHTQLLRGEGLTAGSPVLLSGIVVGEIGEIEIMEDNRVDVELLVLEAHAHRVQAGSKASVRRLLGIGEKRINLVSPAEKGEPLPHGAIVPADEPMDLIDIASALDLGRYMNTLDRAVATMETLMAKLEEEDRLGRMVEAFDDLGPTMSKLNVLLGEIDEPLAELIKDPALRGAFRGADKLFNDPNTGRAVRGLGTALEPERVDRLIEKTDRLITRFDALLADDGALTGTMKGADRLMNDGRLDRMIASMERLTDADKLEKLIDDMSQLADQMAKIGPEIPTMSKELIATMRELAIVLKALQKTWLLDDEAADVRKEMKKKAREGE